MINKIFFTVDNVKLYDLDFSIYVFVFAVSCLFVLTKEQDYKIQKIINKSGKYQ